MVCSVSVCGWFSIAGNGRFGEVQKAVVQSICGESPLRSLACVKIFQGEDGSILTRLPCCIVLLALCTTYILGKVSVQWYLP